MDVFSGMSVVSVTESFVCVTTGPPSEHQVGAAGSAEEASVAR